MSFQSYFDAEMRALQQASFEIQNTDPSTDRLLEGVAYLTAQIQQRLDYDFPEIPAQVIHQHWPHLLQPYPSMVILEFSANTKTVLLKDTLVISEPVGEEKTQCKFSLLSNLNIYPIELIKIELNNVGLKFCFESKQANLKLNKLRLYLDTDINTALEIYYAVGDHNLDDHECGARLWLDYFGFRERFLFIDLAVLENTNTDKYFEINIKLKHMLPPELEIKKDFFKLNCIPAVNKFYYQAEPIVYQSSRYDYRLIPDRNYPESVVLQSIEDVSAEYKWDYLKSKLIIVDKNIENTAVISCGITVSNGFYPGQYIREGMIGELVNRNNLIKLKNITRPTACLLSPSHKNYFWELINLLNLNSRRLEFNKILKLFDWTDKNSVKKQIESILAVEHKAIHKITRGAFYHGREFTLIIKAEGFKATAEIYLFGCVLHQYLKLTSGQNVFIKLDVEVYPSSRILSWE